MVRTHGGAIAVDRGRPELGFDIRRRIEAEAKARIGATAADFVRDGETIAFDASTTALEVAKQLRAHGGWRSLTVITNGLRIAEELAGQDGITILMPGGHALGGPVGRRAVGRRFFRRINVARAFLGAAAFTVQAGLTDATEEEAQIKRAMVAGSIEVTASSTTRSGAGRCSRRSAGRTGLPAS